ncbi:peptidoglycan editing factor PgeF [Gracilibacillus thailandensis]|uniref:Purine nucleoside phosphorylase n=2 Tax=Gracilibacillus thailandensis TaxID=563735 RepID=A0A6N7R5P6_9BACI|nr:peptidoglycan editing factor PgeF [Gracilibacillus thailandensis]MRI68583.1 peptidoglycan editing factor PgeF [Gracilibacillus thailandensis]
MMTEPFMQLEDEGILWIKPWMSNNSNIVAGFTTREGGISHPPYQSNNLGFHVEDNPSDVLQNRQRVAEMISFSLDKWVMADQIHGNHVQFIQSKDSGSGAFSREDAIPETDGLITTEKNVLCTALFADCVPLFFADRKQGTVAISHAGWKGTVSNIAKKTIDHFKQLSSDVKDIEVVIGPSICGSCYQVNDHVIQHIDAKYVDSYQGADDQYQLDLKDLNYRLLVDAGVSPDHIHISKYCTSHHSSFFSHRRDQHPTGRMMGFIAFV